MALQLCHLTITCQHPALPYHMTASCETHDVSALHPIMLLLRRKALSALFCADSRVCLAVTFPRLVLLAEGCGSYGIRELANS